MNGNFDLTLAQVQMVNEFMSRHPELEKATATKFLVGRKFDMARAEQCYSNYCQAVVQHGFQSVTINDVLDELRTKKLYIPGSRDKNGAPLFIINAGTHIPGQFSNHQTLKLAFYLGEVLTADPHAQHIGVTIVSNMEGMEWANFDNQFQRGIINFFTDNIPCRVKNIILYKSPWWVNLMVRMISPFLKQKMRERIQLCSGDDIQHFIDVNQLPSDLGGTYFYDHEAFIKREMVKIPTAMTLFPTEHSKETVEKPAPPGTVMLISPEMATRLQEERARVLRELDNKIRDRRASLAQHTLPNDATKMINSRLMRMTLNYQTFPNMEFNLLHMRDTRATSQGSILFEGSVQPIAERPGESYDPAKLEARLLKSIKKDRHQHLKRLEKLSSSQTETLEDLSDELSVTSEATDAPSLVPSDHNASNPLVHPGRMPNTRASFSKLVPAK